MIQLFRRRHKSNISSDLTYDPIHSKLERHENTLDLAQKVQNQASQVPQDTAQSQYLSQCREQVSSMMKLIQDLKLDSPSLNLRVNAISDIMERCLARSADTQSYRWQAKIRRLGRDQKGSSILDQLKEALALLEMELQSVKKIKTLREKATPKSKAYSNADLTRFFENNMRGWNPANQHVNISSKYARVDVSTETEAGDVIHLTISFKPDFEAACDDLASYLSSCSQSIEQIFPRSSNGMGVIRIDTAPKHPAPIILWAGHNVSVHAKLLPLQTSKSTPPSRNSSRESFYSLADKLFRYILDGCVQAPENSTTPKPKKGDTPEIIHIGETLSVDIIYEPKCLYDAECDDDKLVYADFKDDGSQYTFIFVATEEGQASVHFNFANARTFNFTSVDFKIQVEPRQNTTEVPAPVIPGTT
ncbi:hypothetical protein GGR51DRAFT_423672 [Nemania sp. FL0031]|nr:hypothetical protein GGR51DRAFT_423672 [Nemania sp. FL0031]